jgi:hypothetical protein
MTTELLAIGETAVNPVKINGLPVPLAAYEIKEVRTSRFFQGKSMPDMYRFYLPESMVAFTDTPPEKIRVMFADDNRSAVSKKPYLSIDDTEFFLSVKGIGSTTHPFLRYPLSKGEICGLLGNDPLSDKIGNSKSETSPRYITSELWQRYSPYGGQGLEHALYSMRAAEMDDVTSIHGFRICPLVNIAFAPLELEEQIKKLYWYRQFKGRVVQELRLVPSNVRIYFHSGTTIGETIGSVFDLYGINTNEKALTFIRNFLRSGIPYLSLFVRSMKANDDGTFSGLDFYDVWMDKDALVAPDGTMYFADLEGLDWVTRPEKEISEMVNHQFFRQLYEFMYSYVQMEMERSKRFGPMAGRKKQFELILREALKDDEVCELYNDGNRLMLRIGNIVGEKRLVESFPMLDGTNLE